MWHRLSSRTVVIGVAAGVFLVCCLLPIGYFLVSAMADAGPGTPWLDSRQLGLLRSTATLGLGTSLLSTLIGAPLGFVLARVALPRKPLLRLALAAPALLPPYVVALAWMYLGGTRGLLSTVTGSDALAAWTYSLPAAILVLSTVLYPLAMLATEVALRRVDGRLEEAGMLVAPPFRVLRRVTLPLSAPGMVAAALLIFVLAASEFGVPGLLQVRVYTTEVFTAFASVYDFSRAMVLSLPLLMLCLGVVTPAAALIGGRLVVSRRSGGTPAVAFDGWRRPALAAVVIVLATVLALPLLVLVREALAARSPAAVVAGSGASIRKSLLLASVSATSVVAVTVWLGYAGARLRGRFGFLSDVLFVVVFAVPGTILGVGLIGLWNREGLFGHLYATDGMLVLAHLARLLPVGAVLLGAAVRSVPVSHEEAAAAAGAGWVRTMRFIVLPQIRTAALIVWIIAFVLAFGELNVSILVAPPGVSTLPIWIYTMIANSPPSHIALLALLQTAVILTPVAALAAALAIRTDR